MFNEANKDLYLCLVVNIASTKETEYVNNSAISYNKDIRKDTVKKNGVLFDNYYKGERANAGRG